MDNIPPEIVIQVLGHLPYRQLVRCKRISKTFYNTINDAAQLQYIIQLGAAGYTSGQLMAPQASSRACDSLLNLQKEQRSLRKLDQVPYRRVPLDHNSVLLEFVETARATVWETYGDVYLGFNYWRRKKGPKIGVLSLLPSTAAENRFRIVDVGVKFETLRIDVLQDLFVAISGRRIHLRTLTTGLAHPRASLPVFERRQNVSVYAHHMSLSGDWLFFAHRSLHDRIVWECWLYHWPSGNLVEEWTDTGASNDRRCPPSCLVGNYLVEAQYGLVVGQNKHRLLATTELAGSINVYRLPTGPSGRKIRVASYSFPKDGKFGCKMVLPHGVCAFETRQCDGQPSLLEISLNIDRLSICIPTASLVDDEVLSHDTRRPPLKIPWDAWGLKAGRFTTVHRDFQDQQVIGLHWRLGNGVLDLNRYDAAHDVYGPSKSLGPKDISGLLAPSDAMPSITTDMFNKLHKVDKSLKATAQCRWTKCQYPQEPDTLEHIVRDRNLHRVGIRLGNDRSTQSKIRLVELLFSLLDG